MTVGTGITPVREPPGSSQTILPVETFTPPQRIFDCVYYNTATRALSSIFCIFPNRKRIALPIRKTQFKFIAFFSNNGYKFLFYQYTKFF